MWLNSKQAAQYVGCRSIKSFYSWRQRHRIVVLNNGTVSRRDLDRALIVPRKRRAMSQKSLRNLRASSLWRKSGVNEDGCCVRLERAEISRLASSEDYLGPRLRSASSALAPLRMSLRA